MNEETWENKTTNPAEESLDGAADRSEQQPPAVKEASSEPAQDIQTRASLLGDPYASQDYADDASYTHERVYIGAPEEPIPAKNKKKKKAKEKKAKVGVGTVALIVAICMIFSGGAAFLGNYLGEKMTGKNAPVSDPQKETDVRPSVIVKKYEGEEPVASDYITVAETVTPCVVEIRTESVSTISGFWGGNYINSGAGSGVIISEDGLIITNNHVIEDANTIKVILKDGREYEATLVGNDSEEDIAVIRIEEKELPFVLIGDSDSLKVGEEVVAVGNPLGELGGTVTNGIISALSRSVTVEGMTMTLLQTNTAINPGNSGGGLFNMKGELVGIVNAKSQSTSSGTAVEGIGFAIPINNAIKVAEELIDYGYVRGRAVIGIITIEIGDMLDAMRYGVNSLGLYIVESPYNDDLKVGDRITALNGEEITYASDLKQILKNYEIGDTVTLTVVRNGKYVDVEVTLRENVPETPETEAQ